VFVIVVALDLLSAILAAVVLRRLRTDWISRSMATAPTPPVAVPV
jgi:hypothetical protein